MAITGSGPVSASILLSLRKIPPVLFEGHHGTSIHPKGMRISLHGNTASWDYRYMGIEGGICKVAAPNKEVEYKTISPSRYVTSPQIRVELIMSQGAKSSFLKGSST